jgi:hypothetical protein
MLAQDTPNIPPLIHHTCCSQRGGLIRLVTEKSHACVVVRAEVLLHSTTPGGGAPPVRFMKFLSLSLSGTGASLSPKVRYLSQLFNLQCNPNLIQETKAQIQGVRCVCIGVVLCAC